MSFVLTGVILHFANMAILLSLIVIAVPAVILAVLVDAARHQKH